MASWTGHLFFFFFLDGSCKSSFVWSLQEDHCSVADGCCRTAEWWDAKGWMIGGRLREWEMQQDYICMSGKWVMKHSAGLYTGVCLRYDWDAVGGLQSSPHKKIPKLLKASTHGATHSNRVISSSDDFWYVVFLPRFTAPGLFSIPWSAERSILRTHPASAMAGRLQPEMKKVTESN